MLRLLAALSLFCLALTSSFSQDVKVIRLDVLDMVYAPVAKRFYAASYDYTNQVAELVVIEPVWGRIEQRITCPRAAFHLALSSDEKYLYLGTGQGDSAVMRYNLATAKFDLAFSVGYLEEFGQPQLFPFQVDGLLAVPGKPEAVAVLRTNYSNLYGRSIAIYDHGVKRPDTTSHNILPSVMAFNADGSTLYAYNGLTSGFELWALPVTTQGLHDTSASYRYLSNYNLKIETAGGRLYGTDGKVVDISGPYPRLIGTCDVNSYYTPAVEPAPDSAVLYYVISLGGEIRLNTYDKFNFQRLSSRPLPNVSELNGGTSSIGKMIAWGDDGRLAFTLQGQIVILRNCTPALAAPPALPPLNYTVCAYDTLRIMAPAGYADYHWSNGTVGQQSAITMGGYYTYRVADAAGCLSQPSLPFGVQMAYPYAQSGIQSVGNSNVICQGGYLELGGYAGQPDLRYLWSTGDTANTLRVTQPGIYSMRVLSPEGCLSEWSAPFSVMSIAGTPPGQPTISILQAADTVICSPQMKLSGPDGYNGYFWSSGEAIQTIAAWQAGTYRLRVLDGAGCLSEWSKPVTLTTGNPPATPTIQRNGAVLASDLSGVLHQWYRDGQPISGATGQFFTADVPGVYRVQARQGSCLSDLSNEITIP